MAEKLSARERAKIRLGDYAASAAELEAMTQTIEAEDRLQWDLSRVSERKRRRKAKELFLKSIEPPAEAGAPSGEIVETEAQLHEITEAPRRRGRPRKHKSGGQISVWFSSELRTEIRRRAAREGITFSDMVERLLEAGLSSL